MFSPPMCRSRLFISSFSTSYFFLHSLPLLSLKSMHVVITCHQFFFDAPFGWYPFSALLLVPWFRLFLRMPSLQEEIYPSLVCFLSVAMSDFVCLRVIAVLADGNVPRGQRRKYSATRRFLSNHTFLKLCMHSHFQVHRTQTNQWKSPFTPSHTNSQPTLLIDSLAR